MALVMLSQSLIFLTCVRELLSLNLSEREIKKGRGSGSDVRDKEDKTRTRRSHTKGEIKNDVCVAKMFLEFAEGRCLSVIGTATDELVV